MQPIIQEMSAESIIVAHTFISKEAIAKAEKISNPPPGAWLFGNALMADALGENMPYYRSVGVLGALPIVHPDWVDGLLDEIEIVMEEVGLVEIGARSKTARTLADSLHKGFLKDYRSDDLNNKETKKRFNLQKKIYDKLVELAAKGTNP